MVRVFICDEDKKWQEAEAQILNGYAAAIGVDLQIKSFDSTQALLDTDGPAPDALFIATEFTCCGDERDACDTEAVGISSVRQINQMFPRCQVVYVAENYGNVIDVYRTDHLWFVLRDQLISYLPEIVDKYNRIDKERKSNLIIKTVDGITAVIPFRDIIYLERRDRKTIIVTHNRRYEIKDRISMILDLLPPGRFARCHNSFAVNMDKIKEISSKSLHMRNGIEIIISRGYSKAFRNEYNTWMENRLAK